MNKAIVVILIISFIGWPGLTQAASLNLTHGDNRQDWLNSEARDIDSRGGLYLAHLLGKANERGLSGELIGWIRGLYASHQWSLKLPGAKNISPHLYAKAATLTALPGQPCINIDLPIFDRGLERQQSNYSYQLAETVGLVSDESKALAAAWPLARSPYKLSQQFFWLESRGLVNALITGQNYSDWLIRLAIADHLNQVGGQAALANRWRAADSLESLYRIVGEGEMAAILGLGQTGLGLAGGDINSWQRQLGRLELARWLDLAPNSLNLELEQLSQYYRQIGLASLASELDLSLPEAELTNGSTDPATALNRWQRQLSEELSDRAWPSQSPDRLLGLEDLNIWLNQGGQIEATTAIAALSANDDRAWMGLGAIVLAEKLELKRAPRQEWLNGLITDSELSVGQWLESGRPLPQLDIINAFTTGNIDGLNSSALKIGQAAFDRAVSRLNLVPNAPLLGLTNGGNDIPTTAELTSYLTKPSQRQSVNRLVVRSRLGFSGLSLIEKQQTEESLLDRGIELLAQATEYEPEYLDYLLKSKKTNLFDSFDGDIINELDQAVAWPAGTTLRLLELGRKQSASQELTSLEERIRVGADRVAQMMTLSPDSGLALADIWLAVESGSPGVTESSPALPEEDLLTTDNESLSNGATNNQAVTIGGYELEPLDPELAALLSSQANEEILTGAASGQGGESDTVIQEDAPTEDTASSTDPSSQSSRSITSQNHPLLELTGGDLQSALVQATIARLGESLNGEFNALAGYYAPELTTGFDPDSLIDSNFSHRFITNYSLAQVGGEPLDRYLIVRQELIDHWAIECQADTTVVRAAFDQAINDWMDLPEKIEAGQPNRPLQIFVPSFKYLSPSTLKRIQTTWPESDGETILTGVYELPRALYGGLSAGT
ncbi:MAG: hypothetical protein CEO22_56 [Candidatus Berkelbacteria bacterium Gr01-1014_85]|uniref:Uncharacterized protein n=1 Tax=Candidatus Berkelbacteria bacterium Gr01-1014_85 TaxID=2017150 RepID=A0A554JDQ6_9BACT|nr:MAG: hypothetical protein CEO22_56 [Candidatus Berkelbacteria bacterium Gr01-1014_85]